MLIHIGVPDHWCRQGPHHHYVGAMSSSYSSQCPPSQKRGLYPSKVPNIYQHNTISKKNCTYRQPVGYSGYILYALSYITSVIYILSAKIKTAIELILHNTGSAKP